MKTPTLTKTDALEYMREGRPLVRMHTRIGMKWFIAPGGEVSDAVAAHILARSDVQPGRDGMFPGCDQTFRLARDWRREVCRKENSYA